MNFPDSVRYLYALGNELKIGAKWGLDRMRTLLDALGSPHQASRIVHVAGTNGKGSTSALISSALSAASHRTGLFTSPHLVSPTERIQIDGQPVSDEEFAQAFDDVHRVAQDLESRSIIDAHPSYFETVTAMAFLLFSRRNCEWSVIEVGLGGRLDATNVVTPELAVITPVSFDHEAFLGNTLQSIASEKAGIIKPHIPVVVAVQALEAQAVILARAAELHCSVIESHSASISDCEFDRRGFHFNSEGGSFRVGLAGRHQLDNARTALAACRQLGVPDSAIQQGFAAAQWPGRLEQVNSQPDIILDGAHNPAGAKALAAYIREFYSGSPIWLVYGTMRDKAIDEVIDTLFPLADRLILTAPDVPRALRPEALADLAGRPATLTHSVQEAVSLAKTAPPESAVFISGSLFVVGEARATKIKNC